MRALILDGNSRAAVESLQALGRAGVTVDVASVDGTCLAFHSRYARQKIHQPVPHGMPVYLDWLRALDQREAYACIIPATEASLLSLAPLPAGDGLRVKAVLPAAESLAVALDKHRTWELARRTGVAVPEAFLIESLGQLPPVERYPVILKPVRSKVMMEGKLVTLASALAHNQTQRYERLCDWLPWIAVQQQSYVPGCGVGVELLYRHGRKVWHFLHERLHELPLTGGGSSYRRSLAPEPALLEAAQRMLDALEWHGAAMVEFKGVPGGPWQLMEINPRLWGSLALAIDAGVDFPLGLWRLAHNESPGPQPAYHVGYATRDVLSDVQWMKSNLMADHRDPYLMTRSRAASALEWLRPLWKHESWDHFDSRDLVVTTEIIRRALGLKPRLAITT